jgi:hypothetical protein
MALPLNSLSVSFHQYGMREVMHSMDKTHQLLDSASSKAEPPISNGTTNIALVHVPDVLLLQTDKVLRD